MSAPAVAVAAMNRPVAGALCAILSYLAFATNDAIVKDLTARYSVFQVSAMTTLFALLPYAVMVARDGGFAVVRPRQPKLVALRGVLAVFGGITGIYAFSQLPMADVYAIIFVSPVLVTILSIPVLGEKVGRYRWAAVGAGFVGVLVMVRPTGEALSLGHLAAFVNVFIGAAVVLLMRHLGPTEHRTVMVGTVMASVLIVNVPLALFFFVVPPWEDVLRAAAGGTLMGFAQFLIVRSLALAPAGVIAPMQYTILVWGALYGVLLFGDPIKTNVVVGACILVASSVYIMYRERVRQVPKPYVG
ncbi:MAG: DMT family transporter [Rhodospirillales bacterium]